MNTLVRWYYHRWLRRRIAGCSYRMSHTAREHETRAVERQTANDMRASSAGTWDNGGTTKRAPSRVLGGPQLEALADDRSVD